MSAVSVRLRINFATGTLGCMAIVMAIAAPAIFLLIMFVDLSNSNSRGAEFFRMLQAFTVGGVPIGALLLGGYFAYEAAITAWRWVDKTALLLTDDQLLLHPSIYKTPIYLEYLESVTVTYRNSGWARTINPSLIVRWKASDDVGTKQRLIRNIDLKALEAIEFSKRLKLAGKWFESP